MITSIIGKREKKLRLKKENSYQFGDSAMKRKRNMSLPLPGTPNTKTCSPSLLAAMISPSKKLDRS